MKLPRLRNVRARLTLWYVAILAAILLIYGALTSAVFFLQLRGEVDEDAIARLEIVENLLRLRPDGTVFLPAGSHDHPYPSTDTFLEVRSAGGTLLYRNQALGHRALDGDPTPDEGANSYSPRSVRLADGHRVRVVSRRHAIDGGPAIIRLGLSEEALWKGSLQHLAELAMGLPAALGLAGLGGYFVARRALSPLERMARRAREINAEQLNARLDVKNPHDELGQLAAAFNETLAQLERSFGQLRRFTSDAAHELRTPLTAIRSVGEVALRKQEGTEHYREVISSMLEEAGRLSRLVDDLLVMARADAGQIKVSRVNIPALEFAREAAGFLDVLAEEKRQTISVDGDHNLRVEGDRTILRQVLINLLDNAIKYSPHGGEVAVHVRRTGPNTAAIEVVDSGPGIAPEHRARVFDRFYQVDEARTRNTGGAGLGLAIARWGAQAHNGRLELDCNKDSGCIFRVVLPAFDAAPTESA